MNASSFLLLRLAVGMSFFGHGVVRMPKLEAFSGWMVKSFENSMLPEILVLPFSYFLPIAELVIGLFVLLGLFTRLSLISGAVVTIMLLFGSSMIESWDAIPSQLIHVAFFAVLLHFLPSNRYSFDHTFRKNPVS